MDLTVAPKYLRDRDKFRLYLVSGEKKEVLIRSHERVILPQFQDHLSTIINKMTVLVSISYT